MGVINIVPDSTSVGDGSSGGSIRVVSANVAGLSIWGKDPRGRGMCCMWLSLVDRVLVFFGINGVVQWGVIVCKSELCIRFNLLCFQGRY